MSRAGQGQTYPGFSVLESTVGRILSYLKRRGQLIEPQPVLRAARRRRQRPKAVRFALPQAERKPKDYHPERPGDLIQLDTLEVKLTSWFGFKSRLWRHGKPVECGGGLPERQRQKCQLIERTPFEVKAIQVAGGRAGFAAAGGGRPSLRSPGESWG